jgi:hypothetical protein
MKVIVFLSSQLSGLAVTFGNIESVHVNKAKICLFDEAVIILLHFTFR